MACTHDALAGHVRRLRRFAAALDGDEARADRRVSEALREALRRPERLKHRSLKLDLFVLFFETWKRRGDRSFRLLSATRQQTAVMALLEEFSPAEAGFVLDLDMADVLTCAQGAGVEAFLAPERASVLVLEDEALTALYVADLIESMGHRVCGVAAAAPKAVVLARARRPQLILADVRLGRREDGIGAVRRIRSDLAVPAVFVTGYPEDVIRGDVRRSSFVVEKPIEEARLRLAIDLSLRVGVPPRLCQ